MTALLVAGVLGSLLLGAGLLAWLPSLPLVRDWVAMPWDGEVPGE